PIHRATTNTRLVSFETATPFVPYISALKDGVLLHRADKEKKKPQDTILWLSKYCLFIYNLTL
ncbi:hypothetical protein, partial [Haemophilus influenzae]|uniref:hypothetical protein n=1 Tax=Haemophilus influenzae TaxID=727 RepID=UPI001955184B